MRPLRLAHLAELVSPDLHRLRQRALVHAPVRAGGGGEVSRVNLVRRRRAEGVIRGFLEKRAFVVVLLHEPQFGLLALARPPPRFRLVPEPSSQLRVRVEVLLLLRLGHAPNLLLLLALGEHAVAGLLVLFDPRQFPQAPRLVRDGRVLELVVRVHVGRLCVRLRVRDGGLALELELEEPAALLGTLSSVRLVARRPLGVGIRRLFAVFLRRLALRARNEHGSHHHARVVIAVARVRVRLPARGTFVFGSAASEIGTRLLVGVGVGKRLFFFLDGQALLLPRAPRGEPRARGRAPPRDVVFVLLLLGGGGLVLGPGGRVARAPDDRRGLHRASA